MTNSELRDFLLDKIKTHYSTNSRLLYLADLGQQLKDAPVSLPKDASLRKFLQDEMGDVVTVEKLGNQPNKFIVTEKGNQSIETLLQSPDLAYLVSQPRSLLTAFCVKLDGSKQISFSRKLSRYYVGIPTPDASFVEIDHDIRRPDLKPESLTEWSETDRNALASAIRYWLSESQKQTFTSMQDGSGTLLHKLLACQSEEVRQQMMIPGDVADALLRKQ